MDLCAGCDEVQWPAFAVDDRVDFGRAATAADADCLILLPLLRRWPSDGPSRWCCQSGIHRRGPWRSFEAVEFATLEWVDWFNNRQLLEPIGNIPPAEAEERYYALLDEPAMAA